MSGLLKELSLKIRWHSCVLDFYANKLAERAGMPSN